MTESPVAADLDCRHVWHGWSPVAPGRPRLMISHGSGCHVWDMAGRRYLDGVASAMNAICGYAHPRIVAEVSRQLSRLHHVHLGTAGHAPSALLAERLAGLMGGGLSRTFFVNSGSEAVEAAICVASDYWCHVDRPRDRVVTFARGYHGSTAMCRSLTGLPQVRHRFRSPLAVTRVELPAPPARVRDVEALPALVGAFERALYAGGGPGDVIGVLVEPLLNVGGGVVLPPGFLRALRRLCDDAGVLLIVDEVFTGYGRTGTAFAFQREGVEPDIVVTSKGLTGGYVPMGTMTTNTGVYDSFRADPVIGGLRYGHTTSGHAAGCAAALAVLDVLDGDGLVGRAAILGAVLLDGLTAIAGHPAVVDVRGSGLVTTIEMISSEEADRLVSAARDRGVLLRSQGAAVMAMPPLVIDEIAVEEIIAVVTEAVDAVDAVPAPTVAATHGGS